MTKKCKCWAFHPILVTSFLVVFGDKVTKILHNSWFIFYFVLSNLAWKQKTLYRKSCNLSDEKRSYQTMWWAGHVSLNFDFEAFFEVLLKNQLCTLNYSIITSLCGSSITSFAPNPSKASWVPTPLVQHWYFSDP